MVAKAIILFFAALIPGLGVFLLKNYSKSFFRSILVFTGAFFLGITILHILPEVYHSSDVALAGIFILFGYFLQVVLEMYTSGVEHGHLHPNHGDNFKHNSVYGLLLALCIHAFLEGSVLSHDYVEHADHAGNSVFLGLILHKMTAAFALMTVIICQMNSKSLMVVFLVIFSLASPIGFAFSDLIKTVLQTTVFLNYVYAMVAGSFLHISTTIFFESSPGHAYRTRNFYAGILGASLAVIIELIG